jgi:hypothetical protein
VKEDFASKYEFKIALSKLNGFRFYKVLHDLQGIFYKNHNSIWKMVMIEIFTFLMTVEEFVDVKLPNAKTDPVCCYGDWLE